MKKLFLLCLAFTTANLLVAQNVGIGTSEPYNKLQVQGNLLVTAPTRATAAAPTVFQTETMINASTITFTATDSTGRIYDPGGPTGNYNANVTANATITNVLTSVGIELTFESMQLATGDSLIIKENQLATNNLMEVGNGYSSTGKFIFNATQLYIIFKSNNDANVGSGFSLLFKRLYSDNISLPKAAGYAGTSFFYDVKTGVLRSGNHTNAAKGNSSSAFGFNNTASGSNSFATGNNTEASGISSITTGTSTTAAGISAAAMGNNSSALANFSLATGNGTLAEGRSSVAMGWGTNIRSEAGTAFGMYNEPILIAVQPFVTATTPLFIIGNGDNSSTLSNAMVVLKNGNIGIGTNAPAANLHIRHAAGGGLLLENENDNNKWRIYSASGDNNLTFYNNANAEVADINAVTGAYTAISDMRLKKNIQGLKPVLHMLMQLQPTYYHFNWQQPTEQMQIGLLAQETFKLFPELVSYNKEKDLYKMNYAGFSTVAIKAIQEQQVQIENQQKQIEIFSERLKKLETLLQKQ